MTPPLPEKVGQGVVQVGQGEGRVRAGVGQPGH